MWDPTYEQLVLFSNFGFASHPLQSSIVALEGVGGATLAVAEKVDLPCFGSEKWGGARPVDYATTRLYWVSCGAGLVPSSPFAAPAGLFAYDGGTVVAALNGSDAADAAYDPFASWRDANDMLWQFFVRADDRNKTARAPVVACAPDRDYCRKSVDTGAAPPAAQLSARVVGDALYVLATPTDGRFANYSGGCCAESLLVYDVATSPAGPRVSNERAYALDPVVPSDPSIKVSHTFFAWTEAGAPTFNFAATKPGGGGDFVVEAQLVDGAVEYVGHFPIPDSKHVNGVTRFVHNGTGYTATTDLDYGLRLFRDPVDRVRGDPDACGRACATDDECSGWPGLWCDVCQAGTCQSGDARAVRGDPDQCGHECATDDECRGVPGLFCDVCIAGTCQSED